MTPVAAPDGVGVATLPSTSDPLEVGRSAAPEGAGARVLRLAHGRLTLDELVSGAWAAIGAGFPAACPVCDGPMKAHDAGPASCGSCGAQLS
jgi:DnaJ-class molecular chaperone